MGLIKNVLGSSSPDINKVESRKIRTPQRGQTSFSAGVASASGADKADISSVGRELLNIRLEAAGFTSLVEKAETIDTQEIEAIKEKIAANYYFDSEVIDKVVDKLLTLPNFR